MKATFLLLALLASPCAFADKSEVLQERVSCAKDAQGKMAPVLNTLIDGCRDIDFEDIKVIKASECGESNTAEVTYRCVS